MDLVKDPAPHLIHFRKPPALLVRTNKALPFHPAVLALATDLYGPRDWSVASAKTAGAMTPFSGLPHTTGSAGGC